MIDPNSTPADPAPNVHDRRKVVKKLLTGAGFIAGCAVLPDTWIRPVVGQFTLPAHAATSGVLDAIDSVTVGDLETAAEAAVADTASGEYNTSEVYSLSSISGNSKKFSWLSKTGAYYGGQVKFVFSDGFELVVPNAAKSHGANGSTSNYNQAFYFCGTDFPAGAAENNGGRASVFTPPGSGASSVTMHYNR